MMVFVVKHNKHLRTIAMGLTEETVLKTIYFLQKRIKKNVLDLREVIMYIGPK